MNLVIYLTKSSVIVISGDQIHTPCPFNDTAVQGTIMNAFISGFLMYTLLSVMLVRSIFFFFKWHFFVILISFETEFVNFCENCRKLCGNEMSEGEELWTNERPGFCSVGQSEDRVSCLSSRRGFCRTPHCRTSWATPRRGRHPRGSCR